MRALVQRVRRASVTVEGEVVGSIGPGLCVLVGVTHTDDAATADRLATKVWNLRCFDDDDGAMNRSVAEVGGAVLVVSQFTFYGDTRRGRRPSYVDAARPEVAEPLCDAFVAALRTLGAHVETGRFRTHMEVDLVNDGPVTLTLEA
jgi:D-tyrosyl-tRNA(Tyr) deacylase